MVFAFRRSASPSLLACVPVLPAAALTVFFTFGLSSLAFAAEEDPVLPFGQQELTVPAPYSQPVSSHAQRAAPKALMTQVMQEPEVFVGKTVMFEQGDIIGPVLAIRRRLQDEELYLIVEASRFFNSPTDFAIPVTDMRRVRNDRIVIDEYTGMHLRGLQYYAEDYEDISPAVVPASSPE